ncbi:protein kinase [Rhodococcus hoagii]|nr:protein kinase [Prescottella equi]
MTTKRFPVAELRVVGEYRGPGEQLTAETLARQLPPDWVLIANRSLPTKEHDDLDLTVIGQNLIFILEDKYWGPNLKVGPGAWTVKDQPRENPTERVAFLSRKLAGLLKGRVINYPKRGHIVSSYVILSNPNVHVDWSEAGPESDMVIFLEEAAQTLLDEDKKASVSVGIARDAAIAFLDGWKERFAVPDRIGAYKVNQEIAPLGRARVFAAHDDVDNFVLLRCYPMDGWGPDIDPNNLVRRERTAIDKLAESGRTLESQPVFEDPLHRWIVVPIVQKQLWNLSRLLTMQNPPISPSSADVHAIVRLVVDAFEALNAVHSLNVVHRGIAPNRVALDLDGAVKFTDFYLAQVSGEATVAPSLNELADLGVPYRAPECRNFIGVATQSSDIYSLALTFLWWLHDDPKAIPDPTATPIRSELDQVATVLRRCTEPLPTDRPGLDEIIADLTALFRPDEEATPVPGNENTFAPNEVIDGRWRIDRALGDGGFARSWLALDQRSGHRRVLKQYSDSVPNETVKKEYDAASQLVHGRCARVWDISYNPTFLVIEYVAGESLRQSATTSEIPPEAYLQYALDILDALAHMHQNDLLHNDISPGNIIVEPEGRARLIDFGLSRLKGTTTRVGGTPDFSAPEMLTGERTPSSDLYSLGVTFLHSMLRRYPYQVTDHVGADKSTIVPLSTDERHRLGPLGIAIAEQFFRLVALCPADRPTSAQGFADDLRRTAPVDICEGDRLVNPTVDFLRQLYRGSKLGNSGNRGLDSEFGESTYVETLLDTALTPRVMGGELDLVILTGNPGDGKTSYLKKLRGKFLETGANLLKDGLGGWVIETPNRTFAAVHDASEARDGKTSDDLVIEALTQPKPGVGHTALLAINDGRLRQFFIMDYSDLYADYVKAVRAGLGGVSPDSSSRVAYVDLKRRSLAPTPIDPNGIAGRTLDAFTDESRWAACNTCHAREVCPISRNREQLASTGRERLLDLVAISHLKRQRRATFRDFRSAAAWVLTGDLGCEDVHQAIDSGIDLRRGDNSLHFDLAFDKRSTDYLIAEWSDVDPTLLPVAALERKDRGETIHEPWHRRESLNRRAFFGDLGEETDHHLETTPYRYLRDFQVALTSDEDATRLLPRILLGLSRLLGAFGYNGSNLALQDGGDGGWAVLREIDATEFRLERCAPESPYIEQQADELLLTHPRARLPLPLDSVELILRAEDGELINDAAANAIRLEMSLLAANLMLHPAASAIIVNPAGDPRTVTSTLGTIALEASHEG